MASECNAESYADWREFLRSGDIDAVFISTPNYLHFEMAQEALRLGKHVSVEYPMALNLADFDSLVGEAHRQGVVLHHGLTCQLEDYYLTMKRELPKIGRVFCSKARWFGPRTPWYETDEKRGSMWIAFHMHFVDHFRGLFGNPIWIEAVDQSDESAKMPMGVIFMQHREKITGYIEFGHGFVPAPKWSWSILGTTGHLEFDGEGVILHTEAGGAQRVEMVSQDRFDVDTSSFLNQVLHGAAPVISMSEARKAIEISEAAGEAAASETRIRLG
jgi:predicted dehydrogenase